MKPIRIGTFISVVKKEVRKWEEPIVGHYKADPFQVLISCILSLRTQDKTTAGASRRLFDRAKTVQRLVKLPTPTIEKLIYPVGFYRTKARNIRAICKILLDKYKGRVPDTIEALLELPGVGRKTANLVVTEGFGGMGICVDTHVHRISNRWGYVRTQTPEQTEFALRKKLPRKYWKAYNGMLVAFGQNHCKPISPLCSTCKLTRMCPKIGVGKRR